MAVNSVQAIYAQENDDIPYWVKTTAGFWANDKVSDNEFLNLVQYLLSHKIITAPSNQDDVYTKIIDILILQQETEQRNNKISEEIDQVDDKWHTNWLEYEDADKKLREEMALMFKRGYNEQQFWFIENQRNELHEEYVKNAITYRDEIEALEEKFTFCNQCHRILEGMLNDTSKS